MSEPSDVTTERGLVSEDDTATKIVVKIFETQDFPTRVGIAAVIILFLLFFYYMIGGYTNTCGCGSGEPYQNCSGCHRSHSYAHSHPYGGYPHTHPSAGQMSHAPYSNGSTSIYQAGPYLNF
jgi:hypothetical protein